MAKEMPKFNITINYPLPENKKEFESRMAKAVAKVLIETLPPKKVDELIEKYKQRNS